MKTFLEFVNENNSSLSKESIEDIADPVKFIYNHIKNTNPHSGARDALQGIPSLLEYNWNTTPITIYPDDKKIDKKDLYPASKMDVKRYMSLYKKSFEFPAIVIFDDGKKYHIFDGAHRLQAAINLNVPIKAYIGYKDYLESDISKPKIFTYTAYRLPTNEDLIDINNHTLTADKILSGFWYTIVGRGVMSSKNKNMIIESIQMLYDKYPDNIEYSKALEQAKEIKSKWS